MPAVPKIKIRSTHSRSHPTPESSRPHHCRYSPPGTSPPTIEPRDPPEKVPGRDADGGPIPAPPSPAMPLAHSPLAVLNAEHFDDGISAARRTRRPPASSSSEDAPNPKKKPRKQVQPKPASSTTSSSAAPPAAAATDADGKKRARGRPRLDGDTQSSADRRRAQIRNAQRAYRNRKETAIADLQKQVRALRETNEQMSHAFTALNDFAVQRGLLDARPDFGDRLRSTNERFLTLARRTAEVEVTPPRDDDTPAPGLPTLDEDFAAADTCAIPARARGSTPRSPDEDDVKYGPAHPGPVAGALVPQHQQHHPYERHQHHQQDRNEQRRWDQQTLPRGSAVSQGYVPDMVPSMSVSVGPPSLYPFVDPTLTNPDDLEIGIGQDWTNMETVTKPTLENASFPFTDAQLFSVTGSSITHSSLSVPSPLPPPADPSFPSTLSAFESTFGRRLQRYAIERALFLISLPSPPPLRLVRVFGFCLPFESPDDIRRRLSKALGRLSNQSMNLWGAPFHHLGGIGTHFPPGAVSSSPTDPSWYGIGDGSDDDETLLGAAQGSRLGNQGTIDLERPQQGTGFAMGPFTRRVSESASRLDDKQRIKVPGYQGDFYDSDEVELWLRRRGVDIAPAQDFITTAVDLSAFEPGAEHRIHPVPAVDPPAGDSAFITTSSAGYGTLDKGNTSNFVFSGAPYDSQTTLGAKNVSPFMLDMSMLQQRQPAGPLKTLVTLDVSMFVQKLTEKATCLGRSPGFRIENVRQAFLDSSRHLT